MTSPTQDVETVGPVAWRVKDFADGWAFFSSEKAALREVAETGGLMQALYSDKAISDLLAASKAAITFYDRADLPHMPGEVKVLDDLSAAIAKVEGRS